MKSIILGVLCTFTIVAGYEFDDPLFNEVLLQDLLDANDYDGSLLRVRRAIETASTTVSPPKHGHYGPGCHGPPNGREGWKDRHCCEDKIFNSTFHEKMHVIKMECFEEIRKANGESNVPPPDAFHCGGMGRAKREFACVMLCVAKKQNIIDDNDEIMEDETKTMLINEALAPEWAKDKADEIVDKCAMESNRMDEKARSNEIDDEEKIPKCKKTAIKFAHCLFRELAMECPADKQKDTKMCKTLRENGFKRGPGKKSKN